MQRGYSTALILIGPILAAAVPGSELGHPAEVAADQCVMMHGEKLPKDVQIRHFRREGRNLIVDFHHIDWTGEVRCALYRDGSLDGVETLNRGIEVHWTEPPMPTTP